MYKFGIFPNFFEKNDSPKKKVAAMNEKGYA
jgi:hypothetical protein